MEENFKIPGIRLEIKGDPENVRNSLRLWFVEDHRKNGQT
jgi:hypothetical protein